jgi:hypothetical protein
MVIARILKGDDLARLDPGFISTLQSDDIAVFQQGRHTVARHN